MALSRSAGIGVPSMPSRKGPSLWFQSLIIKNFPAEASVGVDHLDSINEASDAVPGGKKMT